MNMRYQITGQFQPATKGGEACESSGNGYRQTVRLALDTDDKPLNKGIGLRAGPSRKGTASPPSRMEI